MIRFLVALALVAFAAAPAAAADPEILIPGCGEGGQCPPEAIDTEAAPDGIEAEGDGPQGGVLNAFPGGLIPGAFPGANPGLPPGLTPRNFPVVLPLGLTPFDVPINLPLGPTPPAGFPFPG